MEKFTFQNTIYELLAIIQFPNQNHFTITCIDPVFISFGKRIETKGVYYHDGLSNNGKIIFRGESFAGLKSEISKENPYLICYAPCYTNRIFP